jgi:hypothetical protein
MLSDDVQKDSRVLFNFLSYQDKVTARPQPAASDQNRLSRRLSGSAVPNPGCVWRSLAHCVLTSGDLQRIGESAC